MKNNNPSLQSTFDFLTKAQGADKPDTKSTETPDSDGAEGQALVLFKSAALNNQTLDPESLIRLGEHQLAKIQDPKERLIKEVILLATLGALLVGFLHLFNVRRGLILLQIKCLRRKGTFETRAKTVFPSHSRRTHRHWMQVAKHFFETVVGVPLKSKAAPEYYMELLNQWTLSQIVATALGRQQKSVGNGSQSDAPKKAKDQRRHAAPPKRLEWKTLQTRMKKLCRLFENVVAASQHLDPQCIKNAQAFVASHMPYALRAPLSTCLPSSLEPVLPDNVLGLDI